MNHDMYPSKLEQRQQISMEREASAPQPYYSCLYRFKDIEDVIALAHALPLPFFNTCLIHFGAFYYLSVMYPQERMTRRKDWGESLILEYGERAKESIHRLEEYGTVIIGENSVAVIRQHFSMRHDQPVS